MFAQDVWIIRNNNAWLLGSSRDQNQNVVFFPEIQNYLLQIVVLEAVRIRNT